MFARLVFPKPTKKQSKLDKFVDKGVEQLTYPRAIYAQTLFTVAYLAINIVTWGKMTHFDPYPFLFLNLVYSLASGYATVFVLNSQRRQDAEARKRQDELRSEIQQVLEENRAQSKVIKKLLGIEEARHEETRT